MSQLRIGVYAICKNEEAFVSRWMDAVSEADVVVVVDTGSTDGTVDALRARGAVVYEETFSPWRFDTARNAALDHLPEDQDICVSIDLDEIFESGWRKKLEDAWQPDTTQAKYSYVWSHHPDGSPDLVYPREKIHSRRGYRWVRPVHEVLEYERPEEEHSIWVDGLVLHHYPDLNKPRAQYLPLLELSVQEAPDDDRAQFWLGREYVFHGEYAKAMRTLQAHLALPSARWDEERSASMRLLAECCRNLGDSEGEKAWLFRAVAECSHVREPFLALAEYGYRLRDWPLVWAMAQGGLGIKTPSGSYLEESACWGSALYDYAAIAGYYLGLYEKAAEYARLACGAEPENPRLLKNLDLIGQKLNEQKPAAAETEGEA